MTHVRRPAAALGATVLGSLLICSSMTGPTHATTAEAAVTGAVSPRVAPASDFRDNGITAHRGYSAAYPENTMLAMRKGIEVGADWIELDVFQTEDGQVVVNHDRTTGRTGDRNLTIADSTYEELRAVDVAHAFREEHGLTTREVPVMRMPLLSDVLTMVRKQDRTRVSIQPKTIPAVDAAVGVVQDLGMQEWVGFNDGSLPGMSRVKELDPSIHVFWDTNTADVDASIATALDRGFESIVMNQNRVTPESIAAIQAAGLEAGAWTPNDMGTIREFWSWGLDRVYTDYAAEALIVTGQDQRTGLRRDLIAHWSFDDQGAARRDGLTDGDSANPLHDGRLEGDAAVTRPGHLGGAVTLDGRGDHVDVPIPVVPNEATAVTTSVWFRPDAPGDGRQAIFETSGDWSVSLELTAGAGRLKYSVRVPGSDVIAESDIVPTAGEWHHAAVVYDEKAGATRLYVDGAEVTGFPHDAKDDLSPNGRLAPSTGLHLGTYRNADGRFFSGALDDAAVWNRALSADEVAGLWNGGKGSAVPRR